MKKETNIDPKGKEIQMVNAQKDSFVKRSLPTTKKIKEVKGYSWIEIRRAVCAVYDLYHHRDSWGVDVIYRESMLQHLPEMLKIVHKTVSATNKRNK